MSKRQIVIVGHGPAGISAALYTLRSGIATTIIGKDAGSLNKAEKIENYYGLPEPVSGKQLVENGIQQAARLGANIIYDEVVGLDFEESLVVKTTTAKFNADAVILTTGAQRAAAKIAGVEEFEGRGVSYCATCDAFFYRGKHVAVIGTGEYALHEALDLLPVVGSVTILTNGGQPTVAIPSEIKVITEPLQSIDGTESVSGINLQNGDKLDFDGVFMAIGVAGSGALAKKLGANVQGSKIVVDEKMQTGIPGLYAAGDCTGGLLQIVKAAHEGAIAGMEANKYLRTL